MNNQDLAYHVLDALRKNIQEIEDDKKRELLTFTIDMLKGEYLLSEHDMMLHLDKLQQELGITEHQRHVIELAYKDVMQEIREMI